MYKNKSVLVMFPEREETLNCARYYRAIIHHKSGEFSPAYFEYIYTYIYCASCGIVASNTFYREIYKQHRCLRETVKMRAKPALYIYATINLSHSEFDELKSADAAAARIHRL